MERLGAPGGVDGGLAESSGSLSKRKRSQTPQDNCPPNETGPASSVIKIDESSRVLFRIDQSSFESLAFRIGLKVLLMSLKKIDLRHNVQY